MNSQYYDPNFRKETDCTEFFFRLNNCINNTNISFFVERKTKGYQACMNKLCYGFFKML